MLPVVDTSVPEFWNDTPEPLRAALAQHPLAVSPKGSVMALGHPEVETALRDPRCRTTHVLASRELRSGPLYP
jgi:hypothetical protein